MLQKFYPREYLPSAYQINYAALAEKGVRGVLFDIDNTLVPHGAVVTQEAIGLFEQLRSLGLKTCLISNNQEPRVRPFAEAVDSLFLCNAHKPSRKGYEHALSIMQEEPGDIVFVGDQIFTDIYGANRAGIYSILTEPIHPKEEIQIVVKRRLERLILFGYRRKNRKNA